MAIHINVDQPISGLATHDKLAGFAVLLGIVAVIGVLVAIGQLIERRHRRRITEMIERLGGKLVAIKRSHASPHARVVRYIAEGGELRQAFASLRTEHLDADCPFELVLREEYESSRPDILRALKLASQYGQLPGWERYKLMLMELAKGTAESISIEESPSNTDPQRRFAPIYQCLQAAMIGSDESEPSPLKLNVNNEKFDLHRRITGTAPHRTLVLSAMRQTSA